MLHGEADGGLVSMGRFFAGKHPGSLVGAKLARDALKTNANIAG